MSNLYLCLPPIVLVMLSLTYLVFCLPVGCKISGTMNSIKKERRKIWLQPYNWLTTSSWDSHTQNATIAKCYCRNKLRQSKVTNSERRIPQTAVEEQETGCISLNINPALWACFLHSFIAFTLPWDEAQFEAAQGVDYLFSDKTGFNLRV